MSKQIRIKECTYDEIEKAAPDGMPPGMYIDNLFLKVEKAAPDGMLPGLYIDALLAYGNLREEFDQINRRLDQIAEAVAAIQQPAGSGAEVNLLSDLFKEGSDE